ncbi:MAG: tetratricopeptide repeat protein [Anaerolineae bacterium]|jgi:tetratricopeptide (TPR) repeat protein|nr:tetratricopeptide repeat protein [Anaerolineae bacterium]
MQLPPILGFARSRYYYLLAGTYRHFGNTNHLVSEYERAVEAFTRAVTLDPAFARAYLERGILYWRELDLPRRAILDLTRAYDLDGTLHEARFNRGIAHQQLREYGEAMADFRAYLEEGKHPYWREYAESMLRELSEWVASQ